MKTIKELMELHKELADQYRKRNVMYAWMDRAFRSDFDLPAPLSNYEHIRKIVSTDPYVALRAGTWVLSANDPIIKINPMSMNPKWKDWANTAERVLYWELYQASRRRPSMIRSDLVSSALSYDEIDAQVMFLPHQKKAVAQFGGDENRVKAIERYGDFIIVPHNPKTVYPVYSDYGLEAVMNVSTHLSKNVKKFWGDRAKKLSDDDTEMKVYDYWDHGIRAVWVMEDRQSEKEAVRIMEPEEHGLPFIPWVCKVGGTTLHTDPEFQRIPMLFPIYRARQWATVNIMQTMAFSEVITHGTSPRWNIDGAGSDNVVIDHTDPDGILATQGQRVTPMQAPAVDTGMIELSNFLSQAMKKSTIPEVLQGVMPPSGMAYAAMNLATQSALNVVKPYKELAELALAEICELMLLWAEDSGATLKAWGIKKDDWGQPYEIKSTDIDPDHFKIDVELRPDLPVDRMQEITGARVLVSELGFSKARTAKLLGEEDWESMQQEKTEETLYDMHIRNMQMQEEGEISLSLKAQEAAIMQRIQMAGQAAMMQNAPPAAPSGPAANMNYTEPVPSPTTPPGAEGEVPPGMNPAEGNPPPHMANPNITYERKWGRPRKTLG
jgi:hypothetical protein